MNKENTVIPSLRVRIKKQDSLYNDKLGEIVHSNCDGTFHVRIWQEGNPAIDVKPINVEPC